ncbi:MAG: SCO1664 family protein, partial [Bellilinea sp.]
PSDLLLDMQRLVSRLDQPIDALPRLLAKLLSTNEVQALAIRIRHLLDTGIFPSPNADRRHYPWPPI